MMHMEAAPKEVFESYMSGTYDRSLLSYYRFSMDDLFYWTVRERGDLPRFIPVPEEARPKGKPEATSTRPEAKDRRACQEIAEKKWQRNDQIRIAEMARDRDIQLVGNGKLYSEATLVRWLREVAPPGAKGRRGRPLKKAAQKPR